jgi:NAD(P)-dependent dehydrogenase (short-subunit alcohol dehydrogenase family)
MGGTHPSRWGGQLRVQANGHDDPAQVMAGLPVVELLPDLRGRRAVVTGAARGIGEAIAKWLIMAGADVTVVDKDSQVKSVFRTESCQVMEADLYTEDVVAVAEDILANGPVELLVNNVGITTPHGVMEVGGEELDLVFGTNLTGPWLFTKRLVDGLIEAQARTPGRVPRPRGSILFISSLHDRFVAHEAHYSVSKAGVSMLVKALAKKLGQHRIRVNAISPGWIRTAEDITTPEQVAKYERLRPRIPLGQAGVPADVARVALFLLSDAWSGYITGQNLPVDGGLSLHNWLDE